MSEILTIGEHEHVGNDVAICPQHGGRIALGLAQGDYYGKRYWCPVGREHWTLRQQSSAARRVLKYPKLGIV